MPGLGHRRFRPSQRVPQYEVIFTEPPPGFDKQGRDLVARLFVALYGSKQGALKRYRRLCTT